MTAMFNSSDLEGEVDHSFFDSDNDQNEQKEKGVTTEKERQSAHERLHAKQTENTKGGLSPRTDRAKTKLKPLENSSSRAERKETSCQSKEENLSRASSVSSVTRTSVTNNRRDSDDDSDLHSKTSNGTFMALLAGARDVDHLDVHSQSPNESEEEALPSNDKPSGRKQRNKHSPKKRFRNRHTRSKSSTSSEASADADSESSSSSNRRGSLGSPNLPRPNRSSLSPRVSSMRVDSAGSRGLPASHTESDDTVTDVSPLSSPDSSPRHSLDLNHTGAEEGSLKEQQQQQQQQQQEEESVPSSGLCHVPQDEDSDQDVDETTLSCESQPGGKPMFCYPGGRNRKNYSFTNDEVRSIDRENQRLLQELSRRPRSTPGKKTQKASNVPLIRLSHSALNRQREQQRIERENLAFLKRLESVKATPGLKRSEQLADYQRQVGYLGGPSYPICPPTPNKGRSTSKTPSAGSRSASSAQHSFRAVPSNTSTPRSKKPGAARPAWC